MDDQRFHLTLHSGDRPVMHGWWAKRPTAESMLPVWVGSWGELPGARVTLVDEGTGVTLTTWPTDS
ncbi:hypothetical protein OOK29_10075 [Streptomyces phaeochromogenes]|uniref:hypothetical protein n=1 Tax=Streptomyces phaeochromogenes TaxID=1923 RepID=UPI00225541C1|nr:hypothetical protein [Streptomyces phaeochromogenes]MCX5598486.1 hypothetical protein [Streptomyces phaeochromogenes]